MANLVYKNKKLDFLIFILKVINSIDFQEHLFYYIHIMKFE